MAPQQPYPAPLQVAQSDQSNPTPSVRDAGSIHVVTLSLRGEVYVMGGTGFANRITLFAWGKSPTVAEGAARAYLHGGGVLVESVLGATKPAVCQDPASYTFPEQICGLPDQLAKQAILAKRYPAHLVEETFDALRARQQRLRKGEQLLKALLV